MWLAWVAVSTTRKLVSVVTPSRRCGGAWWGVALAADPARGITAAATRATADAVRAAARRGMAIMLASCARPARPGKRLAVLA